MHKYRYLIWYEVDGEDAYWVAKALEFPGCPAISATREEAIAELDAILTALAEQSSELGIPMPNPLHQHPFGQRFRMRRSRVALRAHARRQKHLVS